MSGFVLALRRVLAAMFAAWPAAAQACFDQGSTPVAASIERAPTVLGCAGATTWPSWHLFTPAHRAPAPHAGFHPGAATALPRVLVRYRCTGFLLVPVVPTDVVAMGYVIDRPEIACTGAAR